MLGEVRCAVVARDIQRIYVRRKADVTAARDPHRVAKVDSSVTSPKWRSTTLSRFRSVRHRRRQAVDRVSIPVGRVEHCLDPMFAALSSEPRVVHVGMSLLGR